MIGTPQCPILHHIFYSVDFQKAFDTACAIQLCSSYMLIQKIVARSYVSQSKSRVGIATIILLTTE